MIKRRLISILLYLLEQDSYITINDIAHYLDVSNRTIRNDLNTLEPWIEELNLTLIKKTGVGIKIEGDPQDELKAYDVIKEKNLYPYPNGPEDRIHYMALKLCTVDFYRIYQFSDDLFVSRASIHKDITILEKQFNQYQITMIRDSSKGISIKGKEKDIRNMMFNIMINDEKFNEFIKLCKSKDYECTGDFIFSGLNLTDDEIKDFIIKTSLRDLNIYEDLTLLNVSQIIIRLLISFVRIQANKPIVLSNDFKNELEDQSFYDDVTIILEKLTDEFKYTFPKDEYYYIQVFFLAFLKPQQTLPYNLNEIQSFTNYLIKKWSKELDIDLTNDPILKNNLMAHLTPVYTRIMHSIPVENTLTMEIQTMYPNTLKTVKKSIEDSDQWSAMQQEDIEFLTLHLAAALERLKEPLNTLLIYSGGLGARSLIKEKIEHALNDVKIIRDVNYTSIDKETFDQIDFIISTVDVQLDNDLPFVLVNNIISNNDLTLLQDVVKKYFNEKNNPKRVD